MNQTHFKIKRHFTLRGWRYTYAIIAGNGKNLSPNQPYNDIRDCENVIQLVCALSTATPVVYVDPLKKPVRKERA